MKREPVGPSGAFPLLLILLGLSGALLFLRGWDLPVLHDRSFYLYNAQELARGRLPYRDFFAIHPPLAWMLLSLPLRVWPGLAAGVGPALALRALSFLWVAGAAISVASLGRRLTGSLTGGTLAALLFVGLTPPLLAFTALGEIKLHVVCAVAAAAALAAAGRWFWAGLAAGAGIMAYYPAGIALGCLAGLLARSERGRRRRSAAAFALGLAIPVALTLGWLAWHGILGLWWAVTVKWIFHHAQGVLGKVVPVAAAGQAATRGSLGRAYRGVAVWMPLAAAAGCLIYLAGSILRSRGRKAFVDAPVALVLAPVTLLALGYSLLERGPTDQLILTPFIALWAAWILAALAGLGGRRVTQGVLFLAVCLAVANVIGVQGGLRRVPSLGDQVQRARGFSAALPATAKVAAVGELWPLVLSGRENSSPFFHLGPKVELAARISGRAPVGIMREILGIRPDVIIIGRQGVADAGSLRALLRQEGYRAAGGGSGLAVWSRAAGFPGVSGESLRRALAGVDNRLRVTGRGARRRGGETDAAR